MPTTRIGIPVGDLAALLLIAQAVDCELELDREITLLRPVDRIDQTDENLTEEACAGIAAGRTMPVNDLAAKMLARYKTFLSLRPLDLTQPS